MIVVAMTSATYEELLWCKTMSVLLGFRMAGEALLPLGFGIAHLHATPDGILGVVLTTLFALARYGLVWLAKGRLLYAISVHFVAHLFLLVNLSVKTGVMTPHS